MNITIPDESVPAILAVLGTKEILRLALVTQGPEVIQQFESGVAALEKALRDRPDLLRRRKYELEEALARVQSWVFDRKPVSMHDELLLEPAVMQMMPEWFQSWMAMSEWPVNEIMFGSKRWWNYVRLRLNGPEEQWWNAFS
jgi:hypothetical protein